MKKKVEMRVEKHLVFKASDYLKEISWQQFSFAYII